MSTGDFPTLDPNDPRASKPDSYSTKLLNQFNESLRDPEQIGPYRILRELGIGGMGSVYLAEQEEPVRRMVALKLIKVGMDTREVLARFEAERQALAIMEHPNIARVLDAGATEQGRPFFVMEYVKGEPITAFCDRQNFTTRQRLQLFSQVCDAIQHAHSKGIIHRDIKPSNVLVTMQSGEPAVKVIDFGVAKATNQRLTEMTLFTEVGQIVGTPEYMSPEQAEMSVMDVDTRSDIYSLGVLLYEMLTGALPFEPKTLRSMAYAEMQKAIRELDPPRPSTRLSSLAAERAGEIANKRKIKLDQLTAELRNELEWIPLKAMRKDRSERYRTATELSDDVQNYLNAKPLIAGPETVIYRMRKFVRRNRTPVLATSVVTLLIFGTIIASLILITRARNSEREQRIIAETNFTRAEANFGTANKAVFDFFVAVREENLLNTPVFLPLQKRLLRSSVDYLRQFASQRVADPKTIAELARVYNTLGTVQTDLNDLADATRLLSESVAIRRKLLALDSTNRSAQYDLAASLQNLARAHVLANEQNQAEPLYQEALQILSTLANSNVPDAARYAADLVTLERNIGLQDCERRDYPASINRFSTAINTTRALLVTDPANVRYRYELAAALQCRGISYCRLAKPADAIRDLTEASELHRAMLTGKFADDLKTLEDLAQDYSNLADQQMLAGNAKDAVITLQRSAETWGTLIKGNQQSPFVANLADAYATLAWNQLLTSDTKSSLESARMAVQLSAAARFRGNLAHALLFNGDFDEAAKIYKEIANQEANPGQSGAAMVLEDYRILTSAGITIPRRGEIEAMLAPAQK